MSHNSRLLLLAIPGLLPWSAMLARHALVAANIFGGMSEDQGILGFTFLLFLVAALSALVASRSPGSPRLKRFVVAFDLSYLLLVAYYLITDPYY